jgi:hypothetical protein
MFEIVELLLEDDELGPNRELAELPLLKEDNSLKVLAAFNLFQLPTILPEMSDNRNRCTNMNQA